MRIALHGAHRGDRGRKGTERQGARDPATRDEGQGKVREGEQTGGRTGPGGRGREGGREGALPRELLRTVLALAGGQRVREGRVRGGEQTGSRTGPGGRGREGGREGALPRELLRTVLALAGGRRVRDGMSEHGTWATWCPTTEQAARSARGHWARRGAAACCHKAARPQRCSVLRACVVSCIEGRQGRGKRARAGRER